MLVSAITATHNRIAKPVNYGFINSRGGDNGADTVNASNFYDSHKRINSTPEEAQLYRSVNEWKAFCHNQIAAGKLDIIA